MWTPSKWGPGTMTERRTRIRASGNSALEVVREELSDLDLDEGSVHHISVDIEENRDEQEEDSSQEEVMLEPGSRSHTYGDQMVMDVLQGVEEHNGPCTTHDIDNPSASGVLSWLTENGLVERDSRGLDGGGWEYVYVLSGKGRAWMEQNS